MAVWERWEATKREIKNRQRKHTNWLPRPAHTSPRLFQMVALLSVGWSPTTFLPRREMQRWKLRNMLLSSSTAVSLPGLRHLLGLLLQHRRSRTAIKKRNTLIFYAAPTVTIKSKTRPTYFSQYRPIGKKQPICIKKNCKQIQVQVFNLSPMIRMHKIIRTV